MISNRRSGKYCSAIKCTNHDKNSTFSFHQFPKDEIMRNQWINATKRKDFKPSSRAVLCSKHFEKDAFLTGIDGGLRIRLKPNAIPTIFDFPLEPPKPIYIIYQPEKSAKKAAVKRKNDEESEDSGETKKKKTQVGGRKALKVDKENSKKVTCCALACTNTSESHTLISLPSDPELRKQWITNIDRKDWVPSNTSALCPIHFEENAWNKNKTALKPDAVPTLNLHGESIKSWISLDQPGCSKDVHLNDESEIDIEENEIFIKQEALEPEIDMGEESASSLDKEPAFESVFFRSTEDDGEGDIGSKTLIKIETLNPDTETIVPETVGVRIKSEPVDDNWDCHECGEQFYSQSAMEDHIKQYHSDDENTQMLIERDLQDSTRTLSDQPASQSSPHSSIASTPNLIAAPICNQGDNTGDKKFLLLLPHKPQTAEIPRKTLPSTDISGQPPSPPPPTPLPRLECASDDSKNFIVSLAHFPPKQRLKIKRKFLEVLDAVEKRNINPDQIVIAYRASGVVP